MQPGPTAAGATMAQNSESEGAAKPANTTDGNEGVRAGIDGSTSPEKPSDSASWAQVLTAMQAAEAAVSQAVQGTARSYDPTTGEK